MSKEIIAKKAAIVEEVVEKFEKAKTLGLDITYDSQTGNFVFNTNAVKPFIIMTGYASSRVMPLDEDSK